MVCIYGLKDPTTGTIRYVGKTSNPKGRYCQHLYNKDINRHKRNWIASLKERGFQPEFVVLEEVKNDEWEEKEKYWISHGEKMGWNLVNLYAGGRYNPAIVGNYDEEKNESRIDSLFANFTEKEFIPLINELSYSEKIEIMMKVYISILDIISKELFVDTDGIVCVNKNPALKSACEIINNGIRCKSVGFQGEYRS